MSEEKLPPLSPNRNSNNDGFMIAQIRGEMMKVQQSIQRLSSDYDQLKAIIPEGLHQTISQLESNSHILDTKVTTETSRNWLDELSFLASDVESINYAYDTCNEQIKKLKQSEVFEQNCHNFELSLNKENEDFIEKLQSDVIKRVDGMKGEDEKDEEPSEESQDPLKLTAMMVEVNEEKQNETVYIKKRPDPELSLRVKRHTDRIRHIEDLLQYYSSTIKTPEKSPINDIKELVRTNSELCKEIEQSFEKIVSDAYNEHNDVNVVTKDGKEIHFVTRGELQEAGREIANYASSITQKSINYTNTLQEKLKGMTDRLSAATSKIREVAYGAEVNYKMEELIEENISLIMSDQPQEQQEEYKDEDDVRNAVAASKTKMSSLTSSTSLKLKNINERLQKALEKLPKSEPMAPEKINVNEE